MRYIESTVTILLFIFLFIVSLVRRKKPFANNRFQASMMYAVRNLQNHIALFTNAMYICFEESSLFDPSAWEYWFQYDILGSDCDYPPLFHSISCMYLYPSCIRFKNIINIPFTYVFLFISFLHRNQFGCRWHSDMDNLFLSHSFQNYCSLFSLLVYFVYWMYTLAQGHNFSCIQFVLY